jgi:hypothetical protein
MSALTRYLHGRLLSAFVTHGAFHFRAALYAFSPSIPVPASA